MREFITGNQAIVRGALRAGCNFFAGYPITPASSILSDMIAAFSSGGGVAVQTEDEIAAIGQCIGAAMAGAKAMTASSGPGLCLYSENIGLAQMGEVPLVIVDCQRMGPATGGATATGEGDVVFARHCTSGGYPLPVLAAADVISSYRLTYRAFNIAEQLRTPVIVLTSKDICVTRHTAELDAVELPPAIQRAGFEGPGGFEPYAIDQPHDVPRFAPLGGPHRVRFTGSIHGEQGLITVDRTRIQRTLQHLHDKIAVRAAELEDVRGDAQDGAEVMLLSYGMADGATRQAAMMLRQCGHRVTHLTLYSLWPIPAAAIRRLLPGIRVIVMPELNHGLYAEQLRTLELGVPIISLRRYDGGLIRPEDIAERAAHGLEQQRERCSV